MSNTISPFYVIQQALHGNALLKGGSITDLGKMMRVEPIVLVDQSVLNVSFMPDVMQTLCALFSAYQLQAIAVKNVEATLGVKTLQTLDSLNPNRDAYGIITTKAATVISNESLGIENDSYSLPVVGKPYGLENYGLEQQQPEGLASGKDVNYAGTNFNVKDFKDATSLGVGKLLSITVSAGDKSATLPLTIRLLPAPTSSATMVDILSINSKDNSFLNRVKLWRAGQISGINDLIFNCDLLDEHRKALTRDTNGNYRQILERRKKNVLAALASNTVSLNIASSIYVVSKNTVRQFERATGHDLSDYKTRERIFEESYAMLIAVVDSEWSTVTVYHRGLATAGVYSDKDLKAGNRGNGPDIGDILKAYQLGNQPTF